MKRRSRKRDEKLEGSTFAPDGSGGHWVSFPFADGWTAAQRLARVGGAILVSEVRIYPSDRSGSEVRVYPHGVTPPDPVFHSPDLPGNRSRYYQSPAGQWDPKTTPIPAGGLTSRLVRRVPIGPNLAVAVLDDWLSSILAARPDRLGVGFSYSAETRAVAREVARSLLGEGDEKESPPRIQKSTGKRKGGRRPIDREFLERIASEYNHGGRYPAREIAERHGVPRGTAVGWIYKARRADLLGETSQGRALRSADRIDWINNAKARGLLNGDGKTTTTKGKGNAGS